MNSIIKSALLFVRLYLWRRRQFDNLSLRDYFSRVYDIDVGLYSYGCFDRWRMAGPMRVGRYCSIANTVRSALNNHPTEALTTHPALYDASFGVVQENRQWDGRLIIEDDVWIGHNVIILSGCRHIGRGAIIGAGSVVTKDVERYAVMAGNPARKLRDRFAPELAQAIEASRWWEMPIEALRDLVRKDPGLVFTPDAETMKAWASSPRPAAFAPQPP